MAEPSDITLTAPGSEDLQWKPRPPASRPRLISVPCALSPLLYLPMVAERTSKYWFEAFSKGLIRKWPQEISRSHTLQDSFSLVMNYKESGNLWLHNVMNHIQPPKRMTEAIPRGPGLEGRWTQNLPSARMPQYGHMVVLGLVSIMVGQCVGILVIKYFVYQHWEEVRLPWASVV